MYGKRHINSHFRSVATFRVWEGLERPPFPTSRTKTRGFSPKIRKDKRMNFFIAMDPPTATAQEKKVRVSGGKPIFYNPVPVKEARNSLITHLMMHRPAFPLEGPVSLSTVWLFPRGKSHKHGEWRVTKPDTDNLQKLLKDCMTRCGYWKDDAQVVRETVEKRWSDQPTGIYIEIQTLGTRS